MNNVREEDLDMTIIDAQKIEETNKRISEVVNIVKENGLENDPDIKNAIEEVIKNVRGE